MNIKKLLFSIFFGFVLYFSFCGFSFAKHQTKTRQYFQIKNDGIQPLLGNKFSIYVWEGFNKTWYERSIENQVQREEINIPSQQLDLTVDNDIIYNINKKYFQEKQKKKKDFESQIDSLLSKVQNKEQAVDTINSKYKKYIEIEDTVNKADFIYVLALPIDQFLFKDDNGTEKIIITRKPILQNESGSDNRDLETTINNEINEIMLTSNYKEMIDKINYFREKFDRDYSSLFVEKTLDQFYNDLQINISYKDKSFIQNYSYKNKKFMNNLEYLPKKLKGLEQYSNDYYLIYIPLSINNNVSNILKGLENQKQIFKNSSDFCFKIQYVDNHQQFEDYFCGIDGTFSGSKIKLKQLKINNNNNYYITLSKLGIVSVLLEILFLVVCGLIPFGIMKMIDKVINFGSKFETEQL